MIDLDKNETKKAYMAWKIWVVLLLAYIVSNIHRLAAAVVLDQLMLEFRIDDAAVAGSLAGMFFVMYLIMQIPTGFLADSWGPRKTVTCGMFVAFIGTLCFSLSRGLFLAYVGLGAIGLGVSVLYVCILKFQASWFRPDKYASVTGITLLVGNVGGVIATTPLAYLVTKVGWRGSYAIIAIITLFLAILCWIIVRDTPQDIGKQKKDSSIKTEVSCTEKFTAFAVIINNRYIWPLLFSLFGVAGTLYAFTGTWSFSYLMQVYNFSRSEAANYMMAVAIGKIIGFPISGFASDRINSRKRPALLFFMLYITVWAALWGVGKPKPEILYFVFFLMGLFSGGALTLFPVMAKELNAQEHAGLAVSVINVGTYSGASVLQPLMGYILDKRWNGDVSNGLRVYTLAAYKSVFAFCLFLLILCFGYALTLKDTRC